MPMLLILPRLRWVLQLRNECGLKSFERTTEINRDISAIDLAPDYPQNGVLKATVDDKIGEGARPIANSW